MEPRTSTSTFTQRVSCDFHTDSYKHINRRSLPNDTASKWPSRATERRLTAVLSRLLRRDKGNNSNMPLGRSALLGQRRHQDVWVDGRAPSQPVQTGTGCARLLSPSYLSCLALRMAILRIDREGEGGERECGGERGGERGG